MIDPRSGRAPSTSLPLRYLLTAILAFALAALGVAWLAPELTGHYYQPRVLALTHTVTLGWITLTIMGASYQLIPIVLERRVWSERLAAAQYLVLVAGIVGMLSHFFIGHWNGLVWGAGLLALGTIAHLLNVAMSVRGLARWTFTARLVVLALVGFAATALFGLLLGSNHLVRFMPGELFPSIHAHFHLALLGWVLPMVIGVAARVYPMFLLAREPDGWPGGLQLWGLGVGVPLVVGGIATESALVVPGALAVAAAIGAHVAWVLDMARTSKRPALDWGLRFVLTGTAFLVLASVLGLGFAFDLLGGPRFGLAYAVLALGGWASLTIVGMLLKIVPFLVWYRTYGPQVGRRPVPSLAQLAWPRAEATAYVLLTGGMLALAATMAAGARVTLVRIAGAALAAGALSFTAAIVRVLAHVRHRDATPAAGLATRPDSPSALYGASRS